MTAELPPPPGDDEWGDAEWWARTVPDEGVLYARVVETEPFPRGRGIADATARVEFRGTVEGRGEKLYEQRYVDIPTARRVLTTRGFRRR